MAELNTTADGHLQKKPSRKKLSTRVDLTPMVDLGFLLITFFIFTTSMSEPRSMKLKLPADEKLQPNLTGEGKTINLILGNGHRIWHYRGRDMQGIQVTDYGIGVRQLIQLEKTRVKQQYGDEKELMILIKPSEWSTYEDVVNLLDEMLIHQVSRYVLMEPEKEEVAAIQ